jgi:hypothetical protein
MPYLNPEKGRANARKRQLAYYHRNAEALTAKRKARASYLQKKRDPTVELARRKLRTAIEAGEIVRPEACENFGATPRYALHGHHRDYSWPLDVAWVCRRCHDAIHRADRFAALQGGKP